jgi:hypothetical protein
MGVTYARKDGECLQKQKEDGEREKGGGGDAHCIGVRVIIPQHCNKIYFIKESGRYKGEIWDQVTWRNIQ